MRPLDPAELLDLWEHGLTQSLPRRALSLLRAACPETAERDLLDWPLGQRDEHLLALRQRLFGPDLIVVAPCPACGGAVECTFRVDEVLLPPASATQHDMPAQAAPVIERDGYLVTFRVPVVGDLLALAERPAAESPRRGLLARCVIDVRRPDGAAADIASIPAEVERDIAAGMAAADPQADVQLACACPECGRTWGAVFDIASVVWSEIHAWARRLLRDVHALARAYGWCERDVLSLSPTRRQIYLEIAGS